MHTIAVMLPCYIFYSRLVATELYVEYVHVFSDIKVGLVIL